MIVDARTYTVAAGRTAEYLDKYENNGLPLQTGPLNQVVHYWKWDSAAHRQECRRALYQDPEWTEYRKSNSAGIIVEQFNRLLAATDVVEPFAFTGTGSDLAFVDERTYTITYPHPARRLAVDRLLHLDHRHRQSGGPSVVLGQPGAARGTPAGSGERPGVAGLPGG